MTERETSLAAIQLRRAHAEVEQHAAHRGASHDFGQRVEARVVNRRPVAVGRQACGGGFDRVGVAVESDDRKVRVRVEHRRGVAGAAEGGVDHCTVGNRREQLDDFVDA